MKTEIRRVLIFFQHNPFPPTTGAHQRCLAVIRALRKLGHKVALFGSSLLTDTTWNEVARRQLEKSYGITVKLYHPALADDRYIKSFWQHDRQTFWGHFASPGLTRAFLNFAKRFNPDVVIVNYSYFGELVDHPFFKNKLKILETLDLYSVSEQMQELFRDHFWPAPIDPAQIPIALLEDGFFKHRNIEAWPEEYQACDLYDVSVMVSPKEESSVRAHTRRTQVVRIPITAEVQSIDNTYDGRPLFVAALNMMNAQGYLYFIRQVLPVIRANCPNFVLDVAGSINKHFLAISGVQPKGYVPELADLYRTAPFSICPMLAATGQQIKVVESMSFGVPVVIHKNVADSSPVIHEVNGLIADTPEQFAAHCLRLFMDRKLCKKLGTAARATIAKDWSDTRLTEDFKRILDGKWHVTRRLVKQSKHEFVSKPQKIFAPKVSILLDAQGATTALANSSLQSLLSMESGGLEIIVAGKIAKKYLKNKKIKNSGDMRAAYSCATGNVRVMLCSGDRLFPKAIEFVLNVFDQDKKLTWIQGRPALCDTNGEIIWVMRDPPEVPDTLTLWSRRACVFWWHDSRIKFDDLRLNASSYARFMENILSAPGKAATVEALLGATCQQVASDAHLPAHVRFTKSAPIRNVSREASCELNHYLRTTAYLEQEAHFNQQMKRVRLNCKTYRKLLVSANEQLVLDRWQKLAVKNGNAQRVALFGAGAHTTWLLKLVHRKVVPDIVAILDDNAMLGQTINKIPVLLPKNFDVVNVDVIVLSTDTLTSVFKRRCRKLYGKKIPLVNLYEGMLPGPYPK